jgi:hypothetical protein
MKTEVLTVTSLDEVEIEASSPVVPDAQDDAVLPGEQRGKMRLPTLAGLLRGTGALVIAVAFVIFLFKGWRDGDELSRYLLLMGNTLVLTVAGFASGHFLHENKGARLLVSLALAVVPVSFAFLASMTYDELTWDPATTARMAMDLVVPAAPGDALSSATSLTLAAIAVPVLGIAAWVGFLVMARRSAASLAGLYLLANAGLLIPTRDTLAVSAVLLLLGVLLATSLVRLRRADHTLATGEGTFARFALALPLMVIAGRSVWLYAPGQLFYTTISLIGYLGLRQTSRQLQSDSRWQRVVELLAVGLALSAALFTLATLSELHFIHAALKLPIAAVLFAGLLVDLSAGAGSRAPTYRGAAALVAVAALLMDFSAYPGTLTALACLVGGIGIQVYAYTERRRAIFALGIGAALIGLGYLATEAFSFFSLGGWTGLVLVGVVTVLVGSLVERHGQRIRAMAGSWSRHFRQAE